MIEIHTTCEIDRPAGEVFEYVADMANNPEWQGGMKSCTWTTPPPIGVGSTYDQVAEFRGREIRSSFEVTEFEPGERIRIETTSGPMPIDVTRTVRSVGAGSVVDVIVRGDPSGMFRIAAPLMKRMVKRSVKGDYARLKELLEAT